jgi:hypothetical protein
VVGQPLQNSAQFLIKFQSNSNQIPIKSRSNPDEPLPTNRLKTPRKFLSKMLKALMNNRYRGTLVICTQLYGTAMGRCPDGSRQTSLNQLLSEFRR